MCPAGITCLVGEPGSGFGDPWCFERGGQEVDLFDRIRDGVLFGGHHETPSPSSPNARS